MEKLRGPMHCVRVIGFPMPPVFRPVRVPARMPLRRLLAWAVAAGAAVVLRGQVASFAAAPEGRVEAGAPLFVVQGPEALGLSSAPTDIHLLADGRVMLASAQELAVGDGVRWIVVPQAAGSEPGGYARVAVEADGTVYGGVSGGFARLEPDEAGTWRMVRVAELPAGEARDRGALREVAAVGAEWLWHSGSGSIISWRPGRPARTVARVASLSHLFGFGGQVFYSDQTDGSLWSLEADGPRRIPPEGAASPDDAITCSTPLGPRALLVGTYARGLAVFDGRERRPFAAGGPLAGGQRINDVCATEGGCFAAAVDNLGIVFCDREGRILQVLDRMFDHRLARVRRLLPAPGGIVWALLNDGVARVAFPSRVSYFEPLIASGLASANPFRCAGELWVLADGRAQRGVYDAAGRLLRFDLDSPAGLYVYAFAADLGVPLAGTEAGFHRRDPDGWRRCSPVDLVNGRLLAREPSDGRWLYGARDEVGWMRAVGEAFDYERVAVPGLGDIFGAATERDGTVWMELGASRIARLTLGPAGRPQVRVLGPAAAVPEGWVQIFVVDGVVRFNVAEGIYRFDAAAGRLVVVPEFAGALPEAGRLVGRPTRDALGRLWVGGGGSVQVYDDRGDPPRLLPVALPAGLRPYYFACESDGVVWVRDALRLLRYDPRLPEASPARVRAVIAQVALTASNRTLQRVGAELPELAATDNSLAVRFMAPGCPLGAPVGFEAMLEGAGNEWVPAGAGGAAVYNRLKEGRYRLRVRPRIAGTLGEEATLAIVVAAPWYRTVWAYGGYAGLLVALGGGGFWYATARQRREKARLEREVAARTAELHEANRRLRLQIEQTLRQAAELQAGEERARGLNATLRIQNEETLQKAGALAASEERFRRLSRELEQRVAERTAELNGANAQLLASNRELEAFSYTVSHDLRAPLRNISGFADLLLRRISGRVDAEAERYVGTVSAEAQRLGQLIDSLLGFSRLGRTEMTRGPVDLARLVEAVRAELAPEHAGREVEWRIGPLPVVQGDPTLLRQVWANLLGNALKFTRGRAKALIEVGERESAGGPREVTLFVRDNGVGFDPKYADKLFGVFQRLHSAREFAGSGIGLANVRRIVNRHGGHVWAEAEVGRGATFSFTLPKASPEPAA